MKITISHDAVKREIIGQYSICLDLEDFHTLRIALENALANGFYSGWINIRPRDAILSGPALGWKDNG